MKKIDCMYHLVPVNRQDRMDGDLEAANEGVLLKKSILKIFANFTGKHLR